MCMSFYLYKIQKRQSSIFEDFVGLVVLEHLSNFTILIKRKTLFYLQRRDKLLVYIFSKGTQEMLKFVSVNV